MEQVLSLVSSLDKPTEFLNPSKNLKNKCVTILPRLFSITVSCCDNRDIKVNQLHTRGYGTEDIWQQIEIINDPLLNQAKDLNLDSLIRNQSVCIIRPELLSNDSIESEEEDASNTSQEDSAFEEDMEPMEDEVVSSMDEDEEELPAITGDQFFSLSEMESFVQQAEKENGEIKGGGKVETTLY